MRRKGVPCACNPCKGKNYVRAVNNVSPDPNGDLTIRGGAGIEIIQSGDDLVINNTANPNAFVAGRNIELNPSGDDIAINLVNEPVVDGLTVNGDIIQNGSAYETHAEKVYSKDDYIIMRDGAVAALAAGDYSGFQVKLYDGTNDGRLVIDNTGTARVGDVGNEQPLLTREESANLNNGALLKWDAANLKAVDEGTIGSDLKPIKIVNGVATAVTNDLVSTTGNQIVAGRKTFVDNIDLNIASGKGWIDSYYDSAQHHTGVTINAIDVENNANDGGLFIVFDHALNKVRLIVRKTLNGVATYNLLAEY